MLSFGRVEGVSQPSKKDSLIGVEIKKNPMQVWLSSLSPCCLKPGDRGRLGPEVLADRRSRLLAFYGKVRTSAGK